MMAEQKLWEAKLNTNTNTNTNTNDAAMYLAIRLGKFRLSEGQR